MHIVRPKIEFSVETRPSVVDGHAWWAILTYGAREFSELLPYDLPALSDETRDQVVSEAAQRLKAQLAPVLMLEDGEGFSA